MTKTTETPWHTVDFLDGVSEIRKGNLIIGNICKPDAELIIRAVNSHAALVEALEELVEEAFKNMTGGKGHLIDNAYAALTLAKGA